MTVIVSSYGNPFSHRFPSRHSTNQFRAELCPEASIPIFPQRIPPRHSTRDALGCLRIARKVAGRVRTAPLHAHSCRASRHHHPSPPGEGLRVHLLSIPLSLKIPLISSLFDSLIVPSYCALWPSAWTPLSSVFLPHSVFIL